MCALLLRREAEREPGRMFMASERAFAELLELYRRSLRFVLDHRPADPDYHRGDAAATVYLYIIVPKASAAAG